MCPLRQADQEALKNGVFHSVVDLQAVINRFIAKQNPKPGPFV